MAIEQLLLNISKQNLHRFSLAYQVILHCDLRINFVSNQVKPMRFFKQKCTYKHNEVLLVDITTSVNIS